jgi:flagellar biosynthetic protein FliR
MSWTAEPFARESLVFLLVLARVSAMMLLAPVFGSSALPARLRALLALALTALVVPLELDKHTALPATSLAYLVQLGAEGLIGLSLGLGVLILFSGLQVAGQIVGQMSGLQLGDVFSPGLDTNMPVFSQLLFYVTLAVFLTIGGHRQVMEGLLDTFAWMPAGEGVVSRSAIEAMTSLLTQSFVLGVRAAAPAMMALLLSTIIMGLVSRAVPQLNMMALGLGLNTMLLMVMIGASLGATAWIFQEHLVATLDTVGESFRQAAEIVAPLQSPTSVTTDG